MRIRTFIAALLALPLLALSAAGAAWAGPVQLAPIAYSDDFTEALANNYGEREGVFLKEHLERAMTRALARVGASVEPSAPIVIETTIVDAKPNRPTFQQLTDRPGLDFGRSVSIGGAEVTGIIRRADGMALAEVRHRFFESDIRNTLALSTWGDARRSFERYARKVADAYARVAE